VESKTAAQKVAKVIVAGFASVVVVVLVGLLIFLFFAELRQAVSGITFKHWLAQWLYLATIALALLATAKWVERNIKVGIAEQLSILLVYGFVAFAWLILSGLPIRILLEEK
jgi:hypothetical protein